MHTKRPGAYGALVTQNIWSVSIQIVKEVDNIVLSEHNYGGEA